MNIALLLLMDAAVLTASVSGPAVAADMQRLYVQEAGIEIDPTQLDAYKSAPTENIEIATRVAGRARALRRFRKRENPALVGCSR
jgi:hypothetical protein